VLDHILIVDESRLVREALAKILLSCGVDKTAIACIESVEDAMEYAQFSSISLLICSDNLDETNAFVFRDELVNASNIKHLPLLVLSHHRNNKASEVLNINDNEASNLKHCINLCPPFKKKRVISALFELTQATIFTSAVEQD
jgi:DNA-binding NtrC family response regulator